MAEKGSSSAAKSVDPEFVITRIFDAPRELVFEAWANPKHMAQWWGPRTFANPVCEMDVRPGGAYRITMRSPEGGDYPIKGVFREVVTPERLVMTMDASEHPKEWHDLINPNRSKDDRNPAGEMLATVTFEDLKGKTKLTVRMRLASPEVRDAMVKMGMNEGWSQSLDKLQELLANGAPTSGRELVFTRIFDAPRELVFDVWTDPRHVAQWWGPNGFTTTVEEMDVRPGGVWRLVMRGPDGRDYKNKIVFLDVLKPERLVYKHEPEPGTEPVTFETTVTFAEQAEKTKLTMRMLFPSAAALDHVVKKYGAVEGANQTLGRLENYLAKVSLKRLSETR